MGWRVNPAWGWLPQRSLPARKLTTVLLPAPAPPTTATCSGFAAALQGTGRSRSASVRKRDGACRHASASSGSPAAMIFQPAKIIGQLPDGGPVIGEFHAVSVEFRVGLSSSRSRADLTGENRDATTGTRPFRPVVGGRFTANASSGTQVGLPVKSSVMACAVPMDSCTPARKWPVATKTFSHPGTAPMKGKPSGVAGRSPLQHRSSSAEARPGTSRGRESQKARDAFRPCWPSRRALPAPRSSQSGYGHRDAARDIACRHISTRVMSRHRRFQEHDLAANGMNAGTVLTRGRVMSVSLHGPGGDEHSARRTRSAVNDDAGCSIGSLRVPVDPFYHRMRVQPHSDTFTSSDQCTQVPRVADLSAAGEKIGFRRAASSIAGS